MISEYELEEKILKLGKEIVSEMNEQKPYFNFKSAENILMNWALDNEDLKINLFRLVDTLPSLHSSSDVAKHIKEYFTNQKNISPVISKAAKLSSYKIFSPFVAAAAKIQVKSMSKRFIAGKNPKDALPSVKKLLKRNLFFTIDLLGEAALSEKESTIYLNRYLELIKTLSDLNNKITTTKNPTNQRINKTFKPIFSN
jgi:RHH-type proline utilization regulon transcriptional repressor/proline dehydrogenase/delta 1-pyrroline-5-carboxylate dehydrogenase